jgi:hypothetical protein
MQVDDGKQVTGDEAEGADPYGAARMGEWYLESRSAHDDAKVKEAYGQLRQRRISSSALCVDARTAVVLKWSSLVAPGPMPVMRS